MDINDKLQAKTDEELIFLLEELQELRETGMTGDTELRQIAREVCPVPGLDFIYAELAILREVASRWQSHYDLHFIARPWAICT